MKVVKGSPYKMVKGAITQDLEQGVVEEAPARVKILLNQARFEQITNEHMSNNQLLKYSLIGMKLWSMGGTLQTAHSTSTSSLVTHSLSRGGERTLCRFTRSLKFCTFLQTRGTVHRLCEGEEKLLKISSLTYVFR